MLLPWGGGGLVPISFLTVTIMTKVSSSEIEDLSKLTLGRTVKKLSIIGLASFTHEGQGRARA